MPIRRPCINCHRLTDNGTRCNRCQALLNQQKWQRRPLSAAERTRRSRAVQAWQAEHGNWCPGIPTLNLPAHQVDWPNILTADHLTPIGMGGAEGGPLVVRCRRCNSAKSARREG